MKKIISYVVKFIITERIAKWIAEHGGWVSGESHFEVQILTSNLSEKGKHFWMLRI